MRQIFDLLESLFVDGREWVAGTSKPSLADLEGLWPIDWVITGLGAPKKYFSAEKYPAVFAWHKRFRSAVDQALARAPKPVALRGEQAVACVTAAAFSDTDVTVDENDPTQLARGTVVEFFPTDGGGFFHQDRGELVKLSSNEVAIAIKAPSGQTLHLHAPRWQFKIRAVQPPKSGARL
jgi:hypothetical protein